MLIQASANAQISSPRTFYSDLNSAILHRSKWAVSKMTMNPMPGLLDVIAHHWGFRSLRPLQDEAMKAVLAGRDSLVVLPTGGGKSLCYQAPAVHRGGTTVVLSPLIALMKDQVDSLRSCGVAAAQIDSSLSGLERDSYERDLRQGALRLLFVAP